MESHNSTMVRFKQLRNNYDLYYLLCHNSTMVRFKRDTVAWNPKFGPRHNSTMVRFKQYKGYISQYWGGYVTIPLWFDSNQYISMCKNMHFYFKIKYFVEKFFRKFSQT